MALFSHPAAKVVPISPRPQTADERFDAVDRRLDAMAADLRAMLAIVTRMAARLDEDSAR